MAKRPNKDYVAANQKFLSELATQPEIHTLDCGVLYKVLNKVLSSGGGDKRPSLQSVVSVHYEGRLISGRTFDSTRQNSYPETFRLREVVEGWQIALQQMSVGDRWEVYIPSDMGYGDRTIDNIPGGSTLVFDIELLCIN